MECSTDEDMIRRARVLALRMHKDQNYGNDPYSVHLTDVVNILERSVAAGYGTYPNAETVAATWMHDILEDTALDAAFLRQQFPDRVVAMVELVTRRVHQSWPDLVRAWDQDLRMTSMQAISARTTMQAIRIKAADRLANCRCVPRPKLREKYKEENEQVISMLARHWRLDSAEAYGGRRAFDMFCEAQELLQQQGKTS